MNSPVPAPTLSPDQADAWDALAETFGAAGIDIIAEELHPPESGKGRVMAARPGPARR